MPQLVPVLLKNDRESPEWAGLLRNSRSCASGRLTGQIICRRTLSRWPVPWLRRWLVLALPW